MLRYCAKWCKFNKNSLIFHGPRIREDNQKWCLYDIWVTWKHSINKGKSWCLYAMILGKYINDIQLLYLKLISMSSKLHFFAAEIIFFTQPISLGSHVYSDIKLLEIVPYVTHSLNEVLKPLLCTHKAAPFFWMLPFIPVCLCSFYFGSWHYLNKSPFFFFPLQMFAATILHQFNTALTTLKIHTP